MNVLRRWLTTLQPAALFAPMVILGVILEFGLSVLASPYQAQGGNLPLKVLASVLAAGVVFAFLGVVYLTLRSHLRESAMRIVLLLCLPIGALLAGMLLGWSRLKFDLDARPLVLFWAAVTLVHVTVFGVALWLAASAIRLHYERLDGLRRERDRLHALDVQARQSLTNLDVESTEVVRARILDGLGPAASGDPQHTLPVLTSTLEDIVRPLSRQLESQTQVWVPPDPLPAVQERINWKAAAVEGMTPRLLSPFWTVVILNIVALPMNIVRTGWLMALEFVLVSFCFAWPMFALLRNGAVRIIGEARGARRIASFVILCILCGLVLALGLLPFTLGGPKPFRFVSLGPIFTLLVVFVSGFAVAAQHQAKASEADLLATTLDLQWQIARSRELHRQRRRALAHAVHGQVQASLAAGILDITASVNAGTLTDDQVRDVHARVVSVVAGLDLRNVRPSPLDVLLIKVQATWGVLANISMDVDPEVVAMLTTDPLCLTTLNDVIPELIFNSVKHGRATDITIHVCLEDQRTVSLIVSDNGQSITETTLTGMGSRLLDESTITWSRVRMGESMVTTAFLTCAASAMTD